MVFCNHCKEEVEVDVDEANGFSYVTDKPFFLMHGG